MRIQVDVEDREARAALASLRARVIDVRPIFSIVAADFRNLEQRRFFGENSWKPDTPDWVARKTRKGRPDRTLVFTGALERSLTEPGAKYSVQRISKRTMTVGTRDPVAHLHAGGTKRMPARSLIRIDESDKRRWVDLVVGHLLGVRRGGLGL